MSRRPSEQSIRNAVTAVIEKLNPPQSLKTFQKLSGGYANLVYDINDVYILRVFFRQGWEANFTSERVALEMLQSVPKVPRVLASGILELEWPCPYVILNKFSGTNAFGVWRGASSKVQQSWAEQIAFLLREVHAIPVSTYKSLDDTGSSSWQRIYDRKMESHLALVQTRPLSGEAHRIVDKARTNYESNRSTLVYQRGPRLVHGDVRLHNVIVEDAVTGLIDWEWAHGGEPDQDLVNLFRFALFPGHVLSEGEAPVSRETHAPLLCWFLDAYPELLEIPALAARLTLYLVDSDLGQLGNHSEVLHRNALERLNGWLHEGLVEKIISGRAH